MIRRSKTPGDSDTRHSTLKPSNQWYKHFTAPHAAMDRNNSNSRNQNHNRPHLDVTLNGTHKIKALIDSGSAICLANSSILNHLVNKSTKGPPITITNCHNHREKTQGCYKATINVDKGLPYPIKNKQVNIHVDDNLPSKLILGNDFLKESGAAINLRKNTFIPPKGKEIIARHINPIPRETADIPRASKPSTAGHTTLGLAPTPYVHNNLYSKEENNILQTTTMSTNTCPTEAPEDGSIVGNYVHRPGEENYIKPPNPKANPSILSLTHDEQTNNYNPPQYGITPEQHSEIIEKILWIYTPQPKEPRFDDPDFSEKPVQDTQTKVTKNQLEQFDTKDVEQEWNPAYQQTIIDQPTHIRGSETQVLDEQSINEIAINPTTAHNQIEQPTTYSTPIFMVAIRNGPNVGQKRFIRDFRNQNIPDRKLTMWSTGEASRTSTVLKTKNSLTNYWDIPNDLSMETSTKTPTSFTLPLKDNQSIWPQPPKNQRMASTSSLERHQPMFRNVQIIKGNYITAGGSPVKEKIHVTGNMGPLVGPGLWTFVGPRPTSPTQGKCAFPPSNQVEELALYQPLAKGKHVVKGLKVKYTQPSVERSEDTSLQKTKQYILNRRTPPVSNVNDSTTGYNHPLSSVLWRTPIYRNMANPITPNREQEHTPMATNTFTRYPKMIENSNRGTITLTKTLLDQWMVRHGSYEQSNDPPRKHSESIDIPCPGTHTTNRGTTWTFYQTAEKSPHTHTSEYYNSETPSTEEGTKHKNTGSTTRITRSTPTPHPRF